VRIAQGRFDEALRESDEAIRTALAVGDRSSLARAYLTRDVARSVLGSEVDMSDTRRALDIYTELGELRGQASAANSLGAYAFLAGRWDEAEALYRRSKEARELAGDPVNAAGVNANLAEILVEQGRHDEAEAVLREVSSIMAAAGDRATGAFADRLRGINSARAGDLEAGAQQLARARATFEEVGAPGDLVEADVAGAELHLLDGRPAAAFHVLDGLTGIDLASIGADHLLPVILRLRGLARSALGDSGRADLTSSLEAARELGADHEVARTIEAMAVTAAAGGEPPSADLEEERRRISSRLGLLARLVEHPTAISGSRTSGRRRSARRTG
jgi:tetratricopeptide (TPR) repeat protein